MSVEREKKTSRTNYCHWKKAIRMAERKKQEDRHWSSHSPHRRGCDIQCDVRRCDFSIVV